MDKRNIKEELENMKLIKLTDNEKHVLWSKVEGGIRARRTYGTKQSTFMGLSSRFVLVAALIVFVLTSGSVATVSAANNAVPGDRLFPIDEALERIELFFTRQENRAERRLEFAEERLEEARIIIALADTNYDNTETSNTSTSTDDDTSTSTDDSDKEEGRRRSRRIARAEHVLDVALGRLEDMRDGFLAEGNDEAVEEIDKIIADLTELAEAHIEFLDAIQNDLRGVRDEFREIRDEIRESRNELKFKFDHKVESDDDNDDDDDEEGDKNKDRNWGSRFRFGKFFDDFGDNHGRGGKIILCHIPPGNHGKSQTISVGSPSASRAHLSHGDTEGRCGDIDDEDEDEHHEDDDEDDDEDEDDDKKAKLTVIKVVVNDDDGSAEVDDFTLFVDSKEVESGDDNEFKVGDYTVSESDSDGYEATFSGDCDESGNVALEDGDDKICTITNDDVPSTEDATPPVISGLTVVVGTSTADIDWDTDEDADSKYWQSVSTPVDTTGTPSAESNDLVDSHSLQLSGLTASTTYFYVVSSTDEAGNTVISTEFSFTTLSE